MPRIAAPTLAEHRELRRDALVSAAADVLRSRGTLTMATVAERAGLSRSAVYEYYSSTADLIADVLVDELGTYVDYLTTAVTDIEDPRARLAAWIRAALTYVSDGRHALVRSVADAPLPPVRHAQVRALHRELSAPLRASLEELECPAPIRQASYIWGIVEAATRRIDAGAPADAEVDAAIAFALAGADLERRQTRRKPGTSRPLSSSA